MIRSRLYIKMYLTVLCGLLLVAMSLGTFAMLADDEDHGFTGKLDRFASALITADMSKQQRQDMLERLAHGLNADVAVFDQNDNYVQGAGALSSKAAADIYLAEDGHRHKREFEATLPNGGHVRVFMDSHFSEAKGKFLLAILIVAIAIGVASLPAVRYLTRRLEDLRNGVEHWGEGALSSRVEVCGQDEIALVARSFNKAADRVEQLINSQKTLLANASHELRSPLARLRMAAEMFEASPSDELRKEIVQNLSELDELVDEILLKSRLDSDQKLELDQLVDLLPLAAEEAAAVGAEVDGEPLTVPGNERLLRRLIRNLVQNAARHGQPPVTVYVNAHSGQARIAVCDQGDGITPEEASRVFEPFYRPAGRSESAGGWGLGLALVAEIARLHGGRAWYSPLDTGGACFTVEIPLTQSPKKSA
jgi:two-component system OmpR family sensor kinase